MFFGNIGLNPSLGPLPRGRPGGGWVYPKMKIEIIFEFPTIENPRIDITYDFWWYRAKPPSGPPSLPPPGLSRGGRKGKGNFKDQN